MCNPPHLSLGRSFSKIRQINVRWMWVCKCGIMRRMEPQAETHAAPSAASQTLVYEIVYLVSLVAQPQRIDSFLDPMRAITAIRQPGEFSDGDEQILRQVRTRVMDYLLKSDPVRSFTKV